MNARFENVTNRPDITDFFFLFNMVARIAQKKFIPKMKNVQ